MILAVGRGKVVSEGNQLEQILELTWWQAVAKAGGGAGSL